MLKDRKSNPSVNWTIRVFSGERDSPRLANQSGRIRSLTTRASSWLSQNTTKSSAYRTTARFPMLVPWVSCLTPRAASMPCSAMFSRSGEITPQTILQTAPFGAFNKRVGRHLVNHAHFIRVDLDPLHQRPNDLPPRLPTRLL